MKKIFTRVNCPLKIAVGLAGGRVAASVDGTVVTEGGGAVAVGIRVAVASGTVGAAAVGSGAIKGTKVGVGAA